MNNSLAEIFRKNSAAVQGERPHVIAPIGRIEEEQIAQRIFHACFSEGIKRENAMKRCFFYEHSTLGPSQGGLDTAVRRLTTEGLSVEVRHTVIPDPLDDHLSPKTPKHVYVLVISW